MKIRLSGAVVGEASGSLGSTVFSHNRYGAYCRNRAVPTKATSTFALAAKGILTAASKQWGQLTTAQRLAWQTWAQSNPIVDRLGDKRILSGQAAVTRLNSNTLNTSGNFITDPPATGSPSPIESITATYDIGAGAFALAFTPTPLAASEYLYVWAAVTNSPGVSYVENLYKLVFVGAAATASPVATIQAAIEARFGTLQVGQQVFYKLQVVDGDTGLMSGFNIAKGTVIST